MGGAVKIAHFSDLHYANETLSEVDRCFGAGIERAIAWGAEAAVVSGDSTDHRLDAHSPALITLANRIRQLSDLCPVLMLQGTFLHEPPGTLDIFRLIGGRFPVFVADGIGQVALRDGSWHQFSGWCASEDDLGAMTAGDALFTCIPTVNKASVAAAVGAQAAAEAVGENLVHLLRGFGLVNQAARAAGIVTVGVSHGTVSGCQSEHGVPMLGLDHEFTSGGLFAAQCSAFLLGHIHKHQHWDQDGRVIAYPGSIGRLHYGEIDAKGCLLWDVAAQGASFEFAETPARRMVHFDFPGLPNMEDLARGAADCGSAFVRIRWSVDEEHRSGVDREAIKAMFAVAAEVKIEARIVPITRSRAAGMSRAQSYTEKLKLWRDATNTPTDGLDERLAEIQISSPEDIAARILAGETRHEDVEPSGNAVAAPEAFALAMG